MGFSPEDKQELKSLVKELNHPFKNGNLLKSIGVMAFVGIIIVFLVSSALSQTSQTNREFPVFKATIDTKVDRMQDDIDEIKQDVKEIRAMLESIR